MTRSPGERLREGWAAQGAVRAGASSTDLAGLERELGVVLPTDLKEYLAIVDGMESGAWVGNEIEFWPIARIIAEADDWACFERGVDATLLPFADFLINSHAYAVRVSAADAPVFLVTGFRQTTATLPNALSIPERQIRCADSFEEFVTRYEQDHPAIYGG